MIANFKNILFNGNYLGNPFGVDDLNFRYSTVPLLIAINVFEHFNSNTNISVKKLFSSFECSSLTVKKYLDQLILQGYISVIESDTDRRVRNLKPTQKLLDQMDIYVSRHDAQ